MKIIQIRHAYGRDLTEFYEDSPFERADDFVAEDRAQQIIAFHTHSEEKPSALLPHIKWPTARILRAEEVDVERAPLHIEDAPDYRPMWVFERAAIRTVARPQSPARGYPRTKVTILLDGKPCNVTFKIIAPEGVYDCPCWALA